MQPIGLEHIIREIAQVYEVHYLKQLHASEHISKLPKLAADMLLSGFPLEIVDGDNAFIPMEWVNAVFSELETILGENKKILLVSVLGVQSSGKSTMLNTMFGLQLTVSDGRCTKGVFCSLIPVDKNHGQFDYDYLLVLDTEGLRSTELEGHGRSRDYEIATFVFGLANVAIVNIKKEYTSEMQDILEIVIHAFIKINKTKSVKSKPSCLFTHQNVSNAKTEEKLESHRLKLLDHLNKITNAAAERKKIKNINKLNDIIELDDKGIHYLPDLWQGTPPMAYVNGKYIEKLINIKCSVLSLYGKSINFNSLKDRISELWNAVLSEDFVFSFCNSEALLAYEKLDKKMEEINSEAKSEFLECKKKATTKLKNCDVPDLALKLEKLNQQIEEKSSEQEDKIKSKIEDFFENHEQKDILADWKAPTVKGIKIFIQLEKNSIFLALKKLKTLIEDNATNKEKVSKFKEMFLEEAKKVAVELQSTPSVSDSDLENRFGELWTNFMRNISTTSSDPNEDRNFLIDSFKTYFGSQSPDFYNQLSQSLSDFSEESLENIQKMIVHKNDITIESELLNRDAHINYILQEADLNQIVQEADKLCRKIKNEIRNNVELLKGQDIEETCIKELVFDKLETFFNSRERAFDFTDEFCSNFKMEVCKLAIKGFAKVKNIYREQNDFKIKIEQDKDKYFALFKNTFDNKTADVIAANQIYQIVLGWHEDAIFRNMAHLISSNIVPHHECFQTKKTFLKEVLLRLLETDNFHSYMSFIKDLESCLIIFFKIIINEILNYSNIDYPTLFEAIIKKEAGKNKVTFEEAMTETCRTCSDPRSIFKSLKNSLKSKFHMTENAEEFQTLQINDLTNFLEFFFKKCEKTVDDCWSRLSTKKSQIDSGWMNYYDGKTPGDLIAEWLIGCKEQCPFCGNICELTENNHEDRCDHRCSLHILQGINGFRNHVTQKLTIENCTTSVDSESSFRMGSSASSIIQSLFGWTRFHPYKKYRDFFPKWKIPPDSSLNSSLYWKRFMARFNEKLAIMHHAIKADIPPEWLEITVEEAKESLLKS